MQLIAGQVMNTELGPRIKLLPLGDVLGNRGPYARVLPKIGDIQGIGASEGWLVSPFGVLISRFG